MCMSKSRSILFQFRIFGFLKLNILVLLYVSYNQYKSMSDYPLVSIGWDSHSYSEVHENVYTLIQFLYEKHQEFDLEGSSTETYVLPKDEVTLIQLVLRDFDKTMYPVRQEEDILQFWYRMCRYRLYQHRQLVDDNEYAFCNKVEEYLKANNLVDRILIARRLLVEFFENTALKSKLFYQSYIVHSNKLDWFEYLMVEIMAGFNVPNLCFPYLSTTAKRKFYCFRQCEVDFNTKYKECILLETLLSYLGLAVNIKDCLRLLRIFNLPYRALDEQTFTALRKLARKDNLSVTQVAISFVGRLRLGESTYAPGSNHPLHQWSSGLIHLVDSLNKCHDILSGAADDSLLAAGIANSPMSVDGAVKSVSQCIRTTCSILRKPGVVDKNMHEKIKATINLSEIPDVCESLIKRICQLSSTTPLLAGGSVRGRGAYKLIRVLLVTESERLKINSSVKHPTNLLDPTTTSPCTLDELPSKNSPRTPLNHLFPRSNTPTTDGRTCKLLQMFISPSTPIVNHFSSPCITSEDTSSGAHVNDENHFLSMPERTASSHYQSNVEYVSGDCSPLGTPTKKLSRLRSNRRSRTLFTDNSTKIINVNDVHNNSPSDNKIKCRKVNTCETRQGVKASNSQKDKQKRFRLLPPINNNVLCWNFSKRSDQIN
ncbi:peptidyl-prolyl cis-trans isomerase-like 4 [Schistosoma japonicum]|nr:peptidyl-prolyl cis-trans isomerase-like 4 [Schistosoma japonicum]